MAGRGPGPVRGTPGVRAGRHARHRGPGPRGPVRVAVARVGAVSVPTPAQRLPPVHRGPAPYGGSGRGLPPGGPSRPARPPTGRGPASRHRQGLSGGPHRGRRRPDEDYRLPHGIQRGRHRPSGGHGRTPPAAPRRGHPPGPRRRRHHPVGGRCVGQHPPAGTAGCPNRGGLHRHRSVSLELVEGRPGTRTGGPDPACPKRWRRGRGARRLLPRCWPTGAAGRGRICGPGRGLDAHRGG